MATTPNENSYHIYNKHSCCISESSISITNYTCRNDLCPTIDLQIIVIAFKTDFRYIYSSVIVRMLQSLNG